MRRRPHMAPEVDWAEAVGWDPSRLGWATGTPPDFPPPSHAPRLPPLAREALSPSAGVSAHTAADLLHAPADWLVRAADLLFTPWSPIPGALASLVEAYGLDPDLHGGDPVVLRFLAGFLAEWGPRRGTPEAAIELMAWLGACGTTHGGVRADADAAAMVAGSLAGGEGLLNEEVLAVWPAAWWRERAAQERPGGFDLRVADGLLLFQADPPRFPLSKGDVLFPVGDPGRQAARLTRLLPPWTVVRWHRVPSPPGAARMKTPNSVVVFEPREGALLDMESLQAVRSVSGHLWTALQHILPSSSSDQPSAGMVLEGLVVNGTPVLNGPPGALEPSIEEHAGGRKLQVGAGTALLCWGGDAVTMRLAEPTDVELPAQWSPGSAEVWKLCLRADAAAGSGRSARAVLRPNLRVVRADAVDQSRDLVIAMSIPGARRWETDIAVLWSPGDERTRQVVDELAEIGEKVWSEAPQGLAWSQAVLGRDWLRYQSTASAALQCAGLALESRALTTSERVALLASLHARLEGSVPEAAARVRAMFGPSEADGPWARRLSTLSLPRGAGGR